MAHLALSVIATAVAIALSLSVVLFGVEVFVKQRDMHGQILGFILSVLGSLCYAVVFSDLLPGGSTSWRSILELLPSVDRADTMFTSSSTALFALAGVYILRIAIYIKLFVIPALTLNDEEYDSQEQVEQRANDYTAPVLAFLTLAITLTAALGGVYAMRFPYYLLVLLGLIGSYFVSSFLRDIRYAARWSVVVTRILGRNLGIWVSRIVVLTIVVIGRAERWRRQRAIGPDFNPGIVRTLRATIAKARAQNVKDRQLLRDLAFGRSR